MNIAVLGGTFDPIHGGHLMVADVVCERLAPAEVVFVPAGQPWLKTDRLISPVADRIEMVRLAIQGNCHYRLSAAETERRGPTYTVDTIRELKSQVSDQDEMYFILGWDNLLDLPRWRKPAELISLCKLVAVPRIGFRVPEETTLEKLLPGLSKRVILLDKPEIDISASVIRERVSRGLPITNLVPPAVEAYIRGKGLYKSSSPTRGED
ncbi:MAG: nicotinate-nucleotide adenylyltransferase [Dehalococcoidales bacterium]